MSRESCSTVIQQICTEYALNTYLQLFADDVSSSLPGSDSLDDGLNDLVELTILRIGVCGAFIVLTDGCSQRLIASGETSKLCSFQEDGWLWLFQQTLAANGCTNDKTFSVPVLSQNDHTSALTSVSDAPHMSFYAGTPIISRKGQPVGAFFVVDNIKRTRLSAAEVTHLTTAARKCINLLEFARERGFHDKWSNVQKQLDVFVQARFQAAQALEDSPSLSRKSELSSETTARETYEEFESQHFIATDSIQAKGAESERLLHAEIERDKRLEQQQNARDEYNSLSKLNDNGEPKNRSTETTYQKVFKRAAQCLQDALEADGVLFVDGLLGLHGGFQPVAEPEYELKKEQAQSTQSESSSVRGSKGETVYTSADFRKGINRQIPAEILSISTHTDQPATEVISEDTEGLSAIDESFLQRLMVCYPHGAVWYFSHSTATRVSDEVPLVEDNQDVIDRLQKSFGRVRQLIFQPLTDPTSLKRLAGCFLWKNSSLPLFTDRVDLPSLKEFLHTVESEIARLDAMAAVKQQDSFVSSVSHELRTPLHGILGAVQLLDDTDMDPLQQSLVSTITSCGSTLHETLTSVLSYAKINQFERRQHTHRQRRAPDVTWAIPDKRGFSAGPDRQFKGLYICTNVAMLCEETVGVLEAGQSFSQSGHSEDVMVVCNVGYEDNWEFHTEPGALRRIASNLIGNALKYTAKGSVVVNLSASQTITNSHTLSNDLTTGRTIILTVKDTGKGMSQEFLENHLFVPFTQEDSTSSQGVGLGMSIVKSLVSLLNGEISVQSEVGKGTEITVKIPMELYNNQPDGNEKPTLDTKQMIETLRSRNLSVVVFGFPDFVRNSLETYLRDWFHSKILEATDDAKPDIVLFDESNEQVMDVVRRTARAYGRRGILLSVVMTPSRLAERRESISGYRKMERIPRPLGPIKVGKALLACVAKLDELREEGSGETDQSDQEPSIDIDISAQEKLYMNRDKRDLPIRPAYRVQHKSRDSDNNKRALSHPLVDTNSSDSSLSNPKSTVTKEPLSSTPSKSSSELRVLLVDDNALNLRLLSAFLKKNGYKNLTQAENGQKAVESFRKETFDLIFMDISMPVMDGFEATREIRSIETENQNDIAKATVVVALTGLASERDQEKAFDAGVDLFMTKPVQFGKLSALLKQCEERI